MFLILEGELYDISLEQKNYERVISDLTEDTYKVSKSGRMISWLKESNPYASRTLYWMNLNDGKRLEIKAGVGEYISVLGYIGEDLIYGLVNQSKIKTETNGNILFPIHKLVIRSQDDRILKNYYKEGSYIVDCNILDNQITLKRIQMSENGEYRPIEDDHIASSDIQDKNVTKVNIINDDVYKKTVQLILKNTVNTNSIKIMTPKEVIFEGGREVILDMENEGDYFYVYGPKGVEKITSSSAEAVGMAYELSGSVMDTAGNYIWKKGTFYTRNQIMAITGTKRDGEKGSLAVCLDAVLELEGISRQTQPLLDAGEDALSIMKNSLRNDKILDLKKGSHLPNLRGR